MGVILDTGNEIEVRHQMGRVIMKDSFGTVADMSLEQAIELANLILDEAGKIKDG